MARRQKSLHHNLQPGENVVFHREHRSKRGRFKRKVKGMAPFEGRNGKRAWDSGQPFRTRGNYRKTYKEHKQLYEDNKP